MKKRKSTKAKIRNLVRITVILFLAMIISIIFCRNEIKANNEILENTVKDAFVFQSILLANHLEPNKPNQYTDIENLEDDSESFVSDAAIKTGSSQYYIRVNYGANCVNIYTKDKNKNYTKPYKSMICSTGTSTPTSGTYKITYKYRWLKLFGDVYGQYSTRIVKNILFHSVPYYEQRADTLEWDEYDKLGTKASAGCIRLTVQDAKWIYDNITSGTYVEFYSDKDNPGPLGKPTAQKISDNKKCRDWDPTDPDKNNPWNGGSGIPSIIYTQPKKTQNTTTNSNNSSNQQTQPQTTSSTTTNNNEEQTNTTVPTTSIVDVPDNTNSSQESTNSTNNHQDNIDSNTSSTIENPSNNDNSNTTNNSNNTTSDTKPSESSVTSNNDTPPSSSSSSSDSQTQKPDNSSDKKPVQPSEPTNAPAEVQNPVSENT